MTYQYQTQNQPTGAQTQNNNNQQTIFKKAIILEIILEPSMLSEEKLSYYDTYKIVNKSLLKYSPKNSYIAQILTTDENPASLNEASCYILAPFFPAHLALPCKPGEIVWTFFDSTNIESNFAFWICKITTNNYVEDVNYTHYPRIYDLANRDITAVEDQIKNKNNRPIKHTLENRSITLSSNLNILFDNKHKFVNNSYLTDLFNGLNENEAINNIQTENQKRVLNNPFEFILKNSDASKMINFESVPSYLKKPGDIVFEGSNNSLIVIGTETLYNRYDVMKNNIKKVQLEKAQEKNSGNIDILVGIKNKNYDIEKVINDFGFEERKKFPLSDNKFFNRNFLIPDLSCIPTFRQTSSRFYVSQNTNPDELLDIMAIDLKTTSSIKNYINDEENNDYYNFFINNENLLTYNDKLLGSDNRQKRAAIIQKSDTIRLVARKDIQIILKPESEGASDDITSYSSITIKTNGDIILKPSDHGFLKIGGEDADKVPLCAEIIDVIPSDKKNRNTQAYVKANPIITDGGQQVGLGKYFGEAPLNSGFKQPIISGSYGIFASRVLIK